VKKKSFLTSKDKKDWLNFIKQPKNLHDKDSVVEKNNINKEIRKLDLHGQTLDQANLAVKKFIEQSFQDKVGKLIIITGKGLRSKVDNDPYRSKKMNILKYSIPEYIKNNIELNNKISTISEANLKDGGEGAFYIFLKSIKE
jgi:DNA-nicking Smr family endonuclease